MNIGEVSKSSGVSERMIRHYEKLGLIPPPSRRDSGYREYTLNDVERLLLVGAARDVGMAMSEVAELVSLCCDEPSLPASDGQAAEKLLARLEGKADSLRRLREALAGAETAQD